MCSDEDQVDIMLEGLSLLSNIKSLSLPNTIHCDQNENVASKLNKVLGPMDNLQKLSLSLCNLKGNVWSLLEGLKQKFTFLSLRDCRLSDSDMQFLLEWPVTSTLLDLNISRNNLRNSFQNVLSLIETLEEVRCFSISYCSFSPAEIRHVVNVAAKCRYLKTLGIQSFTPLSESDSRIILKECCGLANIQKCYILPECHAFLGGNELDRFENRERHLEFCDNILSDLNRDDIELE